MIGFKYKYSTFKFFTNLLWQSEVIAYPTEAVFGLGCDPDNEIAVMKLLSLKQRSVNKGLILIAANYQQLKPYIADETITNEQKNKMFSYWPGPIAWVVPAKKTTPRWLTGKFSSLAVRVSAHSDVIELCEAFGKPLVSTSANRSGLPPCRNVDEVLNQFGKQFPVILSKTNGLLNPSEIRDLITDKVIRHG